jgi:hypothetical protein
VLQGKNAYCLKKQRVNRSNTSIAALNTAIIALQHIDIFK